LQNFEARHGSKLHWGFNAGKSSWGAAYGALLSASI
jgi:hypothetical protein